MNSMLPEIYSVANKFTQLKSRISETIIKSENKQIYNYKYWKVSQPNITATPSNKGNFGYQ